MDLICNCKTGDIIKDKETDKKKLHLNPTVTKNGWTVLWKCKICGKYWESFFSGRYDESESLICLSNEEVEMKWHKRV